MHFLARILEHLAKQPDRAALVEVHGAELRTHDGTRLLDLVARARGFLAEAGVQPGDRVALLAPNSARWVAADLAVIASGAIVVPLYDKQAPAELAVVLRSARPRVLLVGTEALADTIRAAWPEHGPVATLEQVFAAPPTGAPVHPIEPGAPVAIIYTSGTSGEPKGVVLTRANVDFMIPRTIERLATVAGRRAEDRVFHFLPLCFAASRMMLWTQLSRPSPVMLSTDLTDLVREMGAAKPHYYLNVPAVLERIRAGVTKKLAERGGIANALFTRGMAAALEPNRAGPVDRAALAVARRLVFPTVKKNVGENLEFLVCGSAPLAESTQRWFQTLGIPVYQAYGLTETTGIVSLDLPDHVVAGRVGIPLPGVEVKVTDEGELLVRGDNVFAGYWERPDETAKVLKDGWFHTGDQVEIEASNLKIVGRIKNLLVPESGHNVAPEPLEEAFLRACPAASQCIVVGHARPFLAIVIPGGPDPAQVEAALAQVNAPLPAYRKIRTAIHVDEPFTAENGLLTANQKLRRAAIERRFAAQIDRAYAAAKQNKPAA